MIDVKTDSNEADRISAKCNYWNLPVNNLNTYHFYIVGKNNSSNHNIQWPPVKHQLIYELNQLITVIFIRALKYTRHEFMFCRSVHIHLCDSDLAVLESINDILIKLNDKLAQMNDEYISFKKFKNISKY